MQERSRTRYKPKREISKGTGIDLHKAGFNETYARTIIW
jgi:hypothetical protein